MKESVMSLLENEIVAGLPINEAYNNLNTITESQERLLGYTPEKVVVMREKGGPYLIEFSNNLERYMVENELTLESAIGVLETMYNIDKRNIAIVLRESDIGKLDVTKLSKEFNFLRFPV